MRRLGRFLILALLLTGCGGSRNNATPVLGVGSTPGKALATIWLSPTSPPSPQPSVEPSLTPAPTLPLPTRPGIQPTLPIGTVGPLSESEEDGTPPVDGTPPAPVVCPAPPPAPFDGVWEGNLSAQEQLGCVSGSPQQRLAAYQSFEHGFMLWSQAEDSIYVLSNTAIQQGQATDTWWRLEDTFTESDPAIDEGLFPPEGLLQPERGFGKVWRNNGFVREAIGWATATEEGYDSTWLAFDNGWMVTSPGVFPIFLLIPSDDPSQSTGVHLGPQF